MKAKIAGPYRKDEGSKKSTTTPKCILVLELFHVMPHIIHKVI